MNEKNNMVDQVNELIDEMEAGRLTRRQLFIRLTALGVMATGLGGLVRPAQAGVAVRPKPRTDLIPTGILIRVDDRAGSNFGRVEGIVRPGAAKLTQVDSSGYWRFKVTKGSASADVDGRPNAFKSGESFDVAANQTVTYGNPTSQEWRFVAELQPAWRPETVTYSLGGKTIKGADLWFELKNSSADTVSRPRYLVQDWNAVANRDGLDREIVPAWSEVTGDACIVEAEAALAASNSRRIQSATFAEKHLAMDRVYTVVSGRGQVILDGNATNVTRGDTGTIPAGVAVQWAATETNIIAEMRPLQPGLWVPEQTVWEMAPGQFLTGDKIWFEMVMPGSSVDIDPRRS